MARTATIRISQGRRGTTIRATGGAAQALFDAITGAAAVAKAAIEAQDATVVPRQFRLCVRVEDDGVSYNAHAIECSDTQEAEVGLRKVKVSVRRRSWTAAVDGLLACAKPTLCVVHWVSALQVQVTDGSWAIDYTVIAEAL